MKSDTFMLVGGILALVAGGLSACGFLRACDMFAGASAAMSIVSLFLPRSPR